MPKLLAAAVALATVAYPFLIYVGLDRIEPRWMALVLVALALARAWAVKVGPSSGEYAGRSPEGTRAGLGAARRPARQSFWLAAAAGAALLAAASGFANAWLPLKLYPVLVNGVLLFVFAASLVRPPSVIERLARLSEPDLPAEGVAYTRQVTQVWCGFFMLNGGIALATALWASNEVWALYNGLVAYALMGVLFGVEWLVRQRVKARMRVAHG